LNKIKKINKTPSKLTQKYIKKTNRMILDLDPVLKIMLNLFSNSGLIDAEKRLDSLDEATDLKYVYEVHADLYKSILLGLNLALDILPKISNLISLSIETEEINRELLIRAGLNRWFFDGSVNKNVIRNS